MKYSTKIYLFLIGTAFVSTICALAIIYFGTRNELIDEFRSKVTSIAATTAAFIDPEQLKLIHTRDDETSPAYLAVKGELIKARDANRREDTYVIFTYTMNPSPDNPKIMVYGADAESNPLNISHAGDVDHTGASEGLADHLHEAYSPGHFITDQWGTWLTGFAPIYDKNGDYVATLGVDIKAEAVLQALYRLLSYQAAALAASILVALGAGYLLSRRATLALNKLTAHVQEIAKGHFEARITFKTKDEFHLLGEEINAMAKGLQERDKLKLNFAHYVSSYILQRILQSETPMKLEGERRKVTVLFADIRNFTHFSEKEAPEEVLALLNEYFTRMIGVIFKNFGTLDKFLGDGLMVEFGAPIEDPYQEKHAVLTALEMLTELKSLCDSWKGKGRPLLKIGIGVNTGTAVVGNIGSEQRMEYTAVGDTVNVASRLQTATKTLDTPLIISESTYEAIKNEFPFVKLEAIKVLGREEPVTVYTIKVDES